MGLFIDIGLIIITLAIILIYTFKGFIKSILGSFKFIFAFLFALITASPIGNWISRSFLYDTVNASVHDSLLNIVNQAEQQINLEELFSKIPNVAMDLINSMGISTEELISRHGNSALTSENLAPVAASISEPISRIISISIAFVAVFLISVLILTLLIHLLDKLFQAPGLRQLNKFLGFLFGCICAFINVTIISSVLTLVLGILATNDPALSVEAIKEQTIIYRFISNINIFSLFV